MKADVSRAARPDYQDHPIRLILLFPPGGETIRSRAPGEEPGKVLSTSEVIESRSGAADDIAAARAA
ncbi:hypothetical protein [Paraburkholderia caballeronis]|uniref:hypothetical protein n=1 Tax=Paraburkholderia caballeronis TaxID=416943 RepID=UPI0010655370|nr:hypothetical protein [Paraburkholderia caballeronis]TDV19445.1 hypothetical protein C7408_102190 [Paraburkholderia caballeronis]TDV22045.1 hypothetical protein C7406_101190 [Paraburkholderia caballeronis]TDV28949.1 hypothetical protein C7404_102191 [Paraburkholderia caballeronis]